MAENSIYLVCECGFFHGDIRLREDAGIECPECGANAADAFADIADALTLQELIKSGRPFARELLKASYVFLSRFVDTAAALEDGFDVYAWCQAVEELGIVNDVWPAALSRPAGAADSTARSGA